MTVDLAVPRKGRPLEAVLDRLAGHVGAEGADSDRSTGDRDRAFVDVADDVISTLRYEKAVTKDEQADDRDVYERLADYSDPDDAYAPDFTLLRDDREGKPRRVVFDALTVDLAGEPVRLVGREEPFRALRTHEFALGFDSADLVLEEVVSLEPEPLSSIEALNARIDPHDTDVRVVTGLGDTVYHTLLATPRTTQRVPVDSLDRGFVDAYEGPLCISPRYERLVEAVLGTDALDGVEFVYPDEGREEEAAVADVGLGVYLTVSGSTAREHGLELGERLFPSETVLLENAHEVDDAAVEAVRDALGTATFDTALTA